MAIGTAAAAFAVPAVERVCPLMLLLSEFCSNMFWLLTALSLLLKLLSFLSLLLLSDCSFDVAAAVGRNLMLLLPSIVLCHSFTAAVSAVSAIAAIVVAAVNLDAALRRHVAGDVAAAAVITVAVVGTKAIAVDVSLKVVATNESAVDEAATAEGDDVMVLSPNEQCCGCQHGCCSAVGVVAAATIAFAVDAAADGVSLC